MPENPGRTPFLRRRFHQLRPRRPRPPSQVTALDIDSQTLRVVQSVPRGGDASITRLVALNLELPADADRTDPALMGGAIARALSQAGLKPGSVVMGVPRAQLVLRTLSLPVIEDIRELASIVHFQLSRDLPFRLDEAVVDFKVRGPVKPENSAAESAAPVLASDAAPGEGRAEPAPGKLEVLVAAVRREVVEFYRQTADAAGLKLAALGLLPYANARCVEACRVADSDHPFALVSLRPDEVSIDIIAWESLLFSRGAAIKLVTEPPAPAAPAGAGSESALGDKSDKADKTDPVAAAEPPRPATFAEAASIEVVRTLHSYGGLQSQNAATKVVVTGATGNEAALVEALTKRLSIPCTLLDPATTFELPAESRDHASGSIGAIGLALGLGDAKGLPFDFLNPKQPSVPRDMRRIRILAGLSAAAAVLVFVLSIRGYLINQRERTRRELVAQLSEAEKKSPIYKRMIQQVGAVDDWTKGNANWIEHCAYLSAILPASEEIYLTSLSISGQGAIRLAVQARSGEILAKLDKQLRAAGYDVKPLAITPGADRHGYEFRSTVELIVPERMKIDLSKVSTPARPADDGSLDPAPQKGGGG
jgi:Tfp pilus assembly PilM family ATPase